MSRPFTVRRDAERGRMDLGWLDARFGFSFAGWRAPWGPRFGALVALNEDRVQPRTGFGPHPHADLEIVALPLRGAIAHRDDRGGEAVVRPGEAQWMRAGRGIVHSQTNPLADTVDHHFQIWFSPRTRGLAPRVEQRPVDLEAIGRWQPVAGAGGGFPIDADLRFAIGRAAAGAPLAVEGDAHGSLYLHVAEGRAEAAFEDRRVALDTGDVLLFPASVPDLRIAADASARLLRFDQPSPA